eukprot:2647792-Rhodomonas_salina.2
MSVVKHAPQAMVLGESEQGWGGVRGREREGQTQIDNQKERQRHRDRETERQRDRETEAGTQRDTSPH